MHQLLNTLYVSTPGAYLRLDHDTVKVLIERETKLQVPLIHISGIVCFGNVSVSPALIRRCGEDGRSLMMHDSRGRFAARIVGPTSGNVLLRRAQHQALSDPAWVARIARNCVAGKIQNSRQILQRASRETTSSEHRQKLVQAADQLARTLKRLEGRTRVDHIRGDEGIAARAYFDVFDLMIRVNDNRFTFSGRVRRPPIGRINALLSFLYALLLNDCVAALDSVGLDPQVGYLHALRPGKPSLALDLMEEFRAIVADRLVLNLVNRRQIAADDFDERPGGVMRLQDDARKAVIAAYQKRKQDEVRHYLLDRAIPLGLVPHIQAQLLARHLRGDLQEYPPHVTR